MGGGPGPQLGARRLRNSCELSRAAGECRVVHACVRLAVDGMRAFIKVFVWAWGNCCNALEDGSPGVRASAWRLRQLTCCACVGAEWGAIGAIAHPQSAAV